MDFKQLDFTGFDFLDVVKDKLNNNVGKNISSQVERQKIDSQIQKKIDETNPVFITRDKNLTDKEKQMRVNALVNSRSDQMKAIKYDEIKPEVQGKNNLWVKPVAIAAVAYALLSIVLK